MKITYSPLVASASGTTANAVAASWKGINYIRQHVIPHNPQTAAQTAVRDALTRCVTLWRSLTNPIKAWLNTYGVDYRMSGFNVFMQKCRTLEQAGDLIKPVPDSPYCPAPSTLAFATGVGASGDIDATWGDNAPADYNSISLVFRLSTGNVFTKFFSANPAAEAHVCTGLTPGAVYDCYAWFVNDDEDLMGTSDGDLDVAAMA